MTETDKYIVFSLLNAALLVTVVFNTVINFYLFVAIIFILIMVCSVLIRRKILKTGTSGKKYFYGVTFPMIVNSFFLINYVTV